MKHLFAVVGMRHRDTEQLVASLRADEPITLVREPDNKYDRNAVQVWARGRHIGYVPKTQNQKLAAHIDAVGKDLAVVLKDDIVGDAQITSKAIEARLHLGSNTYPLVEVDE